MELFPKPPRHMQRATTSLVAVCGRPSACVGLSFIDATQKRSIRNLHRNKQERYKSQVKDSRYNRSWELVMGDNNELILEKGHEREATENFARYLYDDTTKRYIRYVSDPETLSPKARYDYYYSVLSGRKGMTFSVKCTYALKALESFVDMANCGDLASSYDQWKALEQGHFVWLVDHVLENARPLLRFRHTAVAFAIRAAAICDELQCNEKRDHALSASESMVAQMERGYAFSRTGDKVPTLISTIENEPDLWETVRASISKERKAKEEEARKLAEARLDSETPTLPQWSSMSERSKERRRLEALEPGMYKDRFFKNHSPFAPKAWAHIPRDSDNTRFRIRHQQVFRIDDM